MIFIIIVTILTLAAWWKIFKKMGEPGWKGLIPIYNIYIICQRLYISNYFIPYAVIWLLSFFVTTDNVFSTIIKIALMIANALIYDKVSKAFGHGTLFTAGLVFLPPFFHYILAFGKSEYNGPQY